MAIGQDLSWHAARAVPPTSGPDLQAEVDRLNHRALEASTRHDTIVTALQDRVYELDYSLLSAAALAAKAQDTCSRHQSSGRFQRMSSASSISRACRRSPTPS